MKNTFPKFLVECDFDAFRDGPLEWLPTKPLWVARLRNPFALALIDYGFRDKSAVTLQFWPAVVDEPKKLADDLARALFRHHDLYPGDAGEPTVAPGIVEPPQFIHMVVPDTEREFVLEPHEPRLWRVRINRQTCDAEGIEWWRGFGVEPKFPQDTRAVTAWYQKQNL